MYIQTGMGQNYCRQTCRFLSPTQCPANELPKHCHHILTRTLSPPCITNSFVLPSLLTVLEVFDTVDHEILLPKLQSTGLEESSGCCWWESVQPSCHQKVAATGICPWPLLFISFIKSIIRLPVLQRPFFCWRWYFICPGSDSSSVCLSCFPVITPPSQTSFKGRKDTVDGVLLLHLILLKL